MGRRYLAWTLIWLIPIIPVVVLYVLFDQYNVFEFQDAPGGVKAFGPIGAYLVFVLLALRNRRMLEVRLGDDERKFLGSWELTSRSRNGHEAVGQCRIAADGGALSLAGTFAESAKLTSTWRSTMAQLKDGQLLVVYELKDLDRDLSSEGLMKLLPDDPAGPARLEGDWAVIGRAGMLGTVVLTRSDAAAGPTKAVATGANPRT